MSTIQTYQVPAMGLGTDFSEFNRPITYASTYTNRFRNITGAAERRPGASYYVSAVAPTSPNLTRCHEFVSKTGDETLFASDDFGNLYKLGTSAWSTVLTGKANARMISAEADAKLIFCNGQDRNFYTDDGGTSFKELKALITQGTLAGGSNATTVVDGDISNWIGGTLVANNDIIYNITRDAYGIVTTVASASLTCTTIGPSAVGRGFSSSNQTSGDSYQLIDYVDLNIIQQPGGNFDNVATAGTGTTATVVAVSGVDFSTTEIRTGDFIYNTTRGGLGLVEAVSANINITPSGTTNYQIAGQTSGDSLAFFKSAMPIASWIHVHYGRVAYLDARNNQNIIWSAPDDPQDVTTYLKTLESTSTSFGTQQPSGDSLLTMGTFLSYFIAAGKKNLYIYQGNEPVKDTSSSTESFVPIAFYPNGLISRFGLQTNGGDLMHITVNGLQAVSIGYNSFSVNQSNPSTPIINTLKQAISSTTNKDNVQLCYYPQRKWLINKIGDQCFVLNSQSSFDQEGKPQAISSWHLFDGLWAQLNHYFVKRDGTLIGCGPNGRLYYLDNGDATDVGTPITTNLVTAWLRLEEPQQTPRIKEGNFIRPVFESTADVEYTITARAGLDNYSSDSITVSAGGTGAIGTGIIGTTPIGGGSFAQANKYPLRWRGEQVQIGFTTQSSAATDVITSFSLYGNISGVR